jgi:cyanophycinase
VTEIDEERGPTDTDPAPANTDGGAGRLIAIGGFVDRARERDLLRVFYEASGGPGANVVVLALSTEPAELRDTTAAAERFGDVFYDLGAESVEVLRLGPSSSSAAGAGGIAGDRLDLLEFATGLFFAGSGGSGAWLPIPAGALLSEAVRRRHAAGMVVGGSGAGAAVLPDLCIAPALAPPPGLVGGAGAGRRRALSLAPGFGLARGLLLDPPLRQRDRLCRLLTALAVDPSQLAVGIDEDTVVVIDPAGTLEVLGSGAVMVVDATPAIRPGLPAPLPLAGEPPPMLGVRVDLLTAGCSYDLRERRGRPGAAQGANDWPAGGDVTNV